MYQLAEQQVRLHQAELRADAEASRCNRMARSARDRSSGRLRSLGRRGAGTAPEAQRADDVAESRAA